MKTFENITAPLSLPETYTEERPVEYEPVDEIPADALLVLDANTPTHPSVTQIVSRLRVV